MITKNGGWIVQYYESLYLVIPDYDKTAEPETYLFFKIKDHYTYTGVAYKGSDISNAVTRWDLINGLKDSAKDTWSDILEFKQIVLEALIDYNHITFKLTGTAWMNGATGDLHKEKQSDRDQEVFCLKDSKGSTWWAKRMQWRFAETPKEQEFTVIQEPSWYKREKGGYKRGVERNTFRKKLIYDIIPKLVEQYNMIQGLEGGAKETWEDILS
jgi:hypothetical protein